MLLPFYLLPVTLSAQELSTESRKARKAYEKADEYYRMGQVARAEKHFLEATEEDPGFFEAWMMLGDVYEHSNRDSLAITVYRKAIEADGERYPGVYFLLANLEFNSRQFVNAANHYSTYLEFDHTYTESVKKAEKRLANCEFAIEAVANPVPFDPINVGSGPNTEFDEYFPSITADGNTMLFTRLLPDKRALNGRQEDFYISRRTDTVWGPASNVGDPINTLFNEGAPTLSADGSVLIFTACENIYGYGPERQGYGRCDLFITNRRGATWSKPENIGMPVNTGNWESQPSIASDGRTIYFVSNKDDGYDIWMAELMEDDTWSEPVMLNGNINTDGYEGSVFIHPDNRTLYFASDGHPGMGGMDIFMSKRDSAGDWGPPVNLGYPINDITDDNSLLVSADGKTAYFASDREGGFGGLDIYAFDLYEEIRPEPINYLKGIVFDEETGEKLRAGFELIDLETGQVAVNSFSNEVTGEFLVVLPSGKNYALNVSKEGYLFYSDHFALSGSNPREDPYLKDIPLKPIKEGERIVLRNIFYETDKYALKKESRVELDKLVDLMEKNPGLKIEISGHTDNVGSQQYNRELSLNRARSVYDYLMKQDIAKERLSYEGYGFSQPIDTNDTPEGRANNRRTEFEVIGI